MPANVNPNLPKLGKADTAFVHGLCAKYRFVVIAYRGTKLVAWEVSDTDRSPFSSRGIPNGCRTFAASWS
jgi:hypothetical protein